MEQKAARRGWTDEWMVRTAVHCRWCSGGLDDETIVSRLHTRRQLVTQRGIVEFDVEMGEDGSLRLQQVDPFEGLIDTEMADVRVIPESVDDPDIEALKQVGRCAWQITDIG
jgi:hypothetical protein